MIDDINAMGTNTIDIFPGKDWGDEKAASIQTLNERDLDALLGQPYLEGQPQIATSGQLRYRNKTSSGSVVGSRQRLLPGQGDDPHPGPPAR